MWGQSVPVEVEEHACVHHLKRIIPHSCWLFAKHHCKVVCILANETCLLSFVLGPWTLCRRVVCVDQGTRRHSHHVMIRPPAPRPKEAELMLTDQRSKSKELFCLKSHGSTRVKCLWSPLKECISLALKASTGSSFVSALISEVFPSLVHS